MKLQPLLVFALLAAPTPQPGGTDDEVADLLREVKRDRDEVDPSVFGRIAATRTPQAVEALERCAGWVRDRIRVDRLCAALRTYADDPELERQAIDVLGALCFDADRIRANSALRTLVEWGAPAERAVERVVRDHGNGRMRSRACTSVALTWAADRNGDHVRLLVDNLFLGPPRPGPAGASRRAGGWDRDLVVDPSELRDALVSATPGISPVLIEKLLDDSTRTAWRRLLLDVVVNDPGPTVTDALAKLTKDGDSVLALEALHALGKRFDAHEHLRTIAALVRSKNPGQRRAAVAALGKLSQDEQGWPGQLARIVAKKDAALRMGACHALADLRTPEAIALLEELLADDAWPVRSEALWQLVSVRRKDTIPLLIERLAVEQGHLRAELARALCLLTGQAFGHLPQRWRQWWVSEGERFEMPELDEALAIEASRQELGEDRTGATFYGLRILSDRVCFILDTSGSMDQPSGRTRSSPDARGATTRLLVAQRELIGALESFPDGDRFNLIFFADRPDEWKRKLTAMAEPVRRKAIDFTRERVARGRTAVYDALDLAFEDDLVDTIYLLTDGEPTAGKVVAPLNIRRELAAWNEARRITIHAISVGRDSELLSGLAEDSGGRYKRID